MELNEAGRLIQARIRELERKSGGHVVFHLNCDDVRGFEFELTRDKELLTTESIAWGQGLTLNQVLARVLHGMPSLEGETFEDGTPMDSVDLT